MASECLCLWLVLVTTGEGPPTEAGGLMAVQALLAIFDLLWLVAQDVRNRRCMT